MQTVALLFKKAVLNEVKSSVFYNRAAKITENDESRMLFLELASMEDDHVRHFTEIAKETDDVREFDLVSYLAELESSVGQTLTVKESETLKTGDMKAVFVLALSIEKEAKETYLSLSESDVNSEMKDFCQKLAKEEEKHFISLSNQLNSIEMDEEERPAL